MPAASDFETRRFQSAAGHYLAGRPPYPARLVDRVAEVLGIDGRDRLIDLGCGPAQLAIAFARHAGSVLALDPEPNMLAIARDAAAGLANVTVAAGRSDTLGPELGSFRAVVIGRAFHWMDREDTLRRLDGMIEPGGAVILFGDERLHLPETRWLADYEALIERYSDGDADRKRRRSDVFLPHVSVLLGSAFSDLERLAVITRRRIGVETLVDRALSQSSTSRARLGEAADAMVAELRAAAAGWSDDGSLVEVLSSSALIARRP